MWRHAVQVALRGFRKRALGYATCGELIFDEFLAGSWAAEQEQ